MELRGPKSNGVASVVAASMMAAIGAWELVVFGKPGVWPALALGGLVVMFGVSAVVEFRRGREEKGRGFQVICGEETQGNRTDV